MITRTLSVTRRHVAGLSLAAALVAAAVTPNASAQLTNFADLEIEAKLAALTSGSATLQVPVPGGKVAPTTVELATALRAAIDDAGGFASNPAQPADLLTERAVIFRRGAAHLLVEQAIAEVYDGGADTPITTDQQFSAAKTLAGKVIAVAFTEAQIGTKTDRAGVVAALAAGVTHGVNNNELAIPSYYKKALSASVQAMVKGVAALQGNNSVTVAVPTGGRIGNRMDDDDGVLNGRAQAYEAAGAVTGIVSLTQDVGGFGSNSLLSAVVKAAVKAAPKRFLEIAQAASTAAAFVFGNSVNFDSGNGDGVILKAVQAGLGSKNTSTNTARAKQAIAFGIAQAGLALNGDTGAVGAGAKGVRNYAFNSVTYLPVTDISGF